MRRRGHDRDPARHTPAPSRASSCRSGAQPLEHDTVTVDAHDDEDNNTSANDDETVTFELIPPTVTITKTDATRLSKSRAATSTYTIDITNTSFEPVTVTTLTDTITYDRSAASHRSVERADPQARESPRSSAMTPGRPIDITTCSLAPSRDSHMLVRRVTLAGTAQIVRDVVNVVVIDNDSQTDDDDDDEATPITDVLPAVQIVKTAGPAGDRRRRGGQPSPSSSPTCPTPSRSR